MDKVYVFGHQKPDTDSITSAISLAHLKNELGYNATAYRLGEVNKETRFVLGKFNTKIPELLDDVKLQIKDINYYKDYYVNYHDSIYDVFKYMKDKEITGVGVVDEDLKLVGLATNQRIINNIILGNSYFINTSYKNILNVLDGEDILKFDEEIAGTLNKDIFIVRSDNLISTVIKMNVKLIIVTSNSNISDEYINVAKFNHINIIRTSFDTFTTGNNIRFSNYIATVLPKEEVYTFNENDYYDDFVVKTGKLKHNNYPIIGKNGKCLGLIRITDINNHKNKKKVILVDHNETSGSVEGLDEADIIEVVDHHKIGDISTNNPINFRNMLVGATNTIIYEMYKENNVSIPLDIAGLMLAGILSDTLILTSPTTTPLDIKAATELASLTHLDYKKYGLEMFKYATSLDEKDISEIVNSDIKEFTSDNLKFAVSQVFTLDIDNILKKKEEYIDYINKLASLKEYKIVLLLVTDIVRKGSYLFYTEGASEIVSDCFNINKIEEGYYIEKIVSRKKQVIPKLMEVMR